MNFRKQNLKRILGLLALSALLLGATDARAHGRGGCEGFLSQIELTDDQQDAIDNIRNSAREKRRDIFNNDELSREEKHEALKALRDSTQTEIQGVLTEGQLAEIERLKEERATERLNKRIEHLTERLELSDAQANSIRSIFEAAHPQFEEIKNSQATREEKREQMKVIRDQLNTDILEVLDDDQDAIFTQMMERRNKRFGRHRGQRRGA